MRSFSFVSHWLIILLLSTALSSCFSKYRTTARDVRRHYATVDVKPTVSCIQNDSLYIQVASTGADTLPLLLLIHGAPGAWWGYMNILDDPDLQKKFHIVSVDRLGYGKSRFKNKKFITSIQTQAQCLSAVLSLNKSNEKAIILGRSYGAPIAASIAAMQPDKVKELILVSPVIDPEKEKFYWFSKWGRNRLVQLFLPREFNAATAEKYAHSEELRQMLPIWKNVTVPTTVLQGGNDWIADPENIDFAKKHIASTQTQFILLPNAGHMITFSHADLLKEMILRINSYNEKSITIDLSEVEVAGGK
nr:alpha/beta hydrolase [Rhabdobacter roseus]